LEVEGGKIRASKGIEIVRVEVECMVLVSWRRMVGRGQGVVHRLDVENVALAFAGRDSVQGETGEVEGEIRACLVRTGEHMDCVEDSLGEQMEEEGSLAEWHSLVSVDRSGVAE